MELPANGVVEGGRVFPEDSEEESSVAKGGILVLIGRSDDSLGTGSEGVLTLDGIEEEGQPIPSREHRSPVVLRGGNSVTTDPLVSRGD